MVEHFSAAALAVLRPGPVGVPEVFLVERNPRLFFLGGFYAFPGGTVDEAVDTTVSVVDCDLPPGFGSALARETLEETGVLVANGAARLSREQLSTMRRTVLADAKKWPQLLVDHGLTIDGRLFSSLGYWVTPPFSSRIYATYFMAAWLPEGQRAEVWPGELGQGQWLTPSAALAAHQEGAIFLTHPVRETLVVLAEVGGDLAAAAARVPSEQSPPHRIAELSSGLEVVPLESTTIMPATHTNCYLLGHRSLVVVDPGSSFPVEQERLLDVLEQRRAHGIQLKEVWLSHQHADHVGAAQLLRERFGVPVAAHVHTAEVLRGAVSVDRLIVDNEVCELELLGNQRARWQAIHTPGHAAGHLCFFEQQRRLLLSGDHVLSLSTAVIAPPEGNMVQYLASLERLRQLNARFLFPAHGPPVGAVTHKLDSYLSHRQEREVAILACLDTPRTPAEIVARVYQDTNPLLHGLAEQSVRAHLVKLVSEGQVAESNGRYRQQAAANAP